MKIDPIIAVKDVKASSTWYQAVLGCRSSHGGEKFDVLTAADGEVLLCLHKWGEHAHPTMTNPDITCGNGLILYFRTSNMEKIRQNIENMSYEVVEDIHINPNSTKREFSLLDPDGYYLTITEFHQYEG